MSLGLGRYKKLLNNWSRLKPAVLTGECDIDISEAVYTGFIECLAVSMPAGGLTDLVIDLDFDQETTGVNDVATNADTMQCICKVAPDGAVYTGIETTGAITLTGTFGSIATGVSGHRFKLGLMDEDALVKIFVLVSAERADAAIPYRITYTGLAAPTVTAVAAV